MKKLFIIFISFLLAGCASLNRPSTPSGTIIDLKSGEKISFNTLIEQIKNARVVLVGEEHIKKSHHDVQLNIIQGLHEKGLLVAVGMEMFQNSSNRHLEKWSMGNLKEKELRSLFKKDWSRMAYPLYAPIFHAVRKNRLPLVGLNMPRDLTRKTALTGYQSLTKDERQDLPQVSCDVTESYRDYLERVYKSNPHKKGSFDYFCEAQMLWDNAMAYHAGKFLKENPKHRLIILAGSAHAQLLGIPARLEKRANAPIRAIIPLSIGENEETLDHIRADYLWLTD
jgi:uncharacterized iron-regulated protein